MHCIRKNQIPTNIRSSVHHWIRLHPIRCHLLRYRQLLLVQVGSPEEHYTATTPQSPPHSHHHITTTTQPQPHNHHHTTTLQSFLHLQIASSGKLWYILYRSWYRVWGILLSSPLRVCDCSSMVFHKHIYQNMSTLMRTK